MNLTLVDMIENNRNIDRAVTYIEGENAERRVSYGELHARALGISFTPTLPVTVDERGDYSDHLSDGGARPRLMRARDGIHMTMPGYLRIAAPVCSAIRAEVARAWAAQRRSMGTNDPVG